MRVIVSCGLGCAIRHDYVRLIPRIREDQVYEEVLGVVVLARRDIQLRPCEPQDVVRDEGGVRVATKDGESRALVLEVPQPDQEVVLKAHTHIEDHALVS